MKYSTKYMQALFNRINSELFEDELPACHLMAVTGAQCAKVWNVPIDGICIPQKDNYTIAIHDDQTEYQFFNAMVHEMIHVWQCENNKPVGHGGWFRVWAEKAYSLYYEKTLDN